MILTHEQILEKVIEEVKKVTRKNLSNNSPLITSGVVDSLTLMDIIVSFEENFRISITAADIQPENFDTPEQMSIVIRKKMT